MKSKLTSKVLALAVATSMIFTSAAPAFADIDEINSNEVIELGYVLVAEGAYNSSCERFGHLYMDGTTKESTCTEEGIYGKWCVRCERAFEKPTEIVDHSWVEVYDVWPTYEKEGLKSLHCKWCDIVKKGSKEVVPKQIYQADAPKWANANLTGHDDVWLAWQRVEPADGYNIYYKKASDKNYKMLVKIRDGLGQCRASFHAKDLSDGVKYQFKIVPVITIHRGEKTVESINHKVVAITTLKKVNKPVVTKQSNAKVKVKWKNINGETGYQISKSLKKNGTNIVWSFKGANATYKLTKATKGKTYYYKVRAYTVNANGKKIFGPWSNVTSYKLK